MHPYSIVLADDHAIFRHGVRKIIEEMVNFKIIGEAGNGLVLLKLLRSVTPDLIILDISMPNLRGLETIYKIKAIHPDTKILILTMHKNPEYFHRAFSEGTNGYLLKEDTGEELLSAIETILQGNTYISPHFNTQSKGFLSMGYCGVISSSRPLTQRQKHVVKLMAEGNSNKNISEILSIHVRTVENHRANIMKRLNFKNTSDLIKYAIQNGYIENHI